MSWLVLFSFLGLQVFLGAWASRQVVSEADYFVAGRRLGVPLVTLSLLATWFGAETCLGASGIIYEKGLSGARVDPLGYAICLLLMGVFLAKRLTAGRFLTIGDLYRDRFGVRAERLIVFVLVPSSLTWGAAQVRAFGQVLAVTGAIQVETAIVVSAALVVAYTFLGGLMGDVLTDAVQGTLLAVGLVGLLVLTIGALDRETLMVGAQADAVGGVFSAQRLSLLPEGESLWVQIDRWSVPIFGSLIAQELIARVLAARTPSVARRGALLAGGLYLVLGSVPVVLGLLGPALAPGLEQPEQLLPTLAQQHFPHALFLLFSCALLAAILSTIDSILLSASALLSHNLLAPVLKIDGERSRLWLGRVIVVAAGAVCLVVALAADGIYGLVETASSLGTAGVLVTTVAALYLRRCSEPAALAALVIGAVATPVLKYGCGASAPFLTSIALAVFGYVAASTLTQTRTDAGAPSAVEPDRNDPR